MTEEEMGVTEENVASSQEEQTSDGQQINWQKANETMAQQKQELEQLRQEKARMEQQQQLYQAYLQSQYQNSGAASAQAQQMEEDPWAEIPDEDVPLGSNIKKTFGRVLEKEKQGFQQTINELRAELNAMKLQASNSDYKEVVTYGLKAAQTDPQLANAIATSTNPALLAYQLGKAHPEYQEKVWASKQSEEAKKIVENSQKPGSMTRATTGSSPLSKASFFMDLGDDDFEKHIAKIKTGQIGHSSL